MFLLSAALLLDWFVGDPDIVWRRLPHPVVVIGNVIDRLDDFRKRITKHEALRRYRREAELIGGLLLLGVLFLLSLFVAKFVGWVTLELGLVGTVLELLLIAVLLAQRSLYIHVGDVANALRAGGVPAGRNAVARIVGRDVSNLDEAGIASASIESLAENQSDGIVAPALWYALFGVAGIVFYKAVNTADSMIGHRSEEYEYFGKSAARLDDLMNWPAARLTVLLISFTVLLSGQATKAKQVFNCARRDGPQHRSPNAGWPEAAYASVLGIRLGGDRQYGDDRIEGVTLNPAGRAVSGVFDLERALVFFRRTCLVSIAVVFILAVIF